MTHAHSMVPPTIPRPQAYESEYCTWREYASFRPNTNIWPSCLEMRLGRFYAHAYVDGSWRCGLAGSTRHVVSDDDSGRTAYYETRTAKTQEQAVVLAEKALRSMVHSEAWSR